MGISQAAPCCVHMKNDVNVTLGHQSEYKVSILYGQYYIQLLK